MEKEKKNIPFDAQSFSTTLSLNVVCIVIAIAIGIDILVLGEVPHLTPFLNFRLDLVSLSFENCFYDSIAMIERVGLRVLIGMPGKVLFPRRANNGLHFRFVIEP